MENLRDFIVIAEVEQYDRIYSTWREGYIVKYENELYFICEPDNGMSIDECMFWTLDIERHWWFNEVDTNDYIYYTRGTTKRINVEDII